MIPTNKIDGAILKHLYAVQGKLDHSLPQWATELEHDLGVRPDWDEVKSAFKRLRAEGIVRLRKYSEQLGQLYEYRGNEEDSFDGWFFGFASFETTITDHGRAFWDVPRRRIGFQVPA